MTCPAWWPLPDGELIGEERARVLVTWLREVCPPAVEMARARLLDAHPTSPVASYALSAKGIARLALEDGMRGLCIGAVSIPGTSGKPTTVGIALQRNGRLAITVPGDDGSGQAWIET